MSGKGPQTIPQLVSKFLNIDVKNKFVLKRTYDEFAFKQMFADRKINLFIKVQKLNTSAHAELGSDLAVSKFVVGTLRGRIRDHTGRWITSARMLPKDYCEEFKLTGVDASRSKLLTEGIDNFVGLDYLETLDLSKNPLLDDFACDQLSRQLRESKYLSAIDLSDNPLISVYGLEILLRIPSLRQITAFQTQASKFENIDLFTMAAEAERNCKVLVFDDGRQYRSPLLEQLREDELPKLKANLEA